MSPLVTNGFHPITMVAGGARRTLVFYRDVLGLGLVKRTVDYDDPRSYQLYFGDESGAPGTILTFFEWPGAPKGRWGVGGIHHLAQGVETAEAQLRWKRWLTDRGVAVSGPYDRGYFRSIDFADSDGQILRDEEAQRAWRDHLRSLGVEVSPVMDRTYVRSIYFRAPDGLLLEFATDGPGFAIDEPDSRHGTELRLPSWLEGRRAEVEAALPTLGCAVPEGAASMDDLDIPEDAGGGTPFSAESARNP